MLKANSDGKEVSATSATDFKSQSFINDSPSGLYYAYVIKPSTTNDILRYSSINENTFAVNYGFEMTLPVSFTSVSISLIVDELSQSTGWVYIFITGNL